MSVLQILKTQSILCSYLKCIFFVKKIKLNLRWSDAGSEILPQKHLGGERIRTNQRQPAFSLFVSDVPCHILQVEALSHVDMNDGSMCMCSYKPTNMVWEGYVEWLTNKAKGSITEHVVLFSYWWVGLAWDIWYIYKQFFYINPLFKCPERQFRMYIKACC